MATILYPDGGQEDTQPANGRDFQLKELQKIVEGHIQIIPTKDGRIMVLNDEGKLQGLPYNEQATNLIDFPSPTKIKDMLAKYPDQIIFVGDPDQVDYIVGTVLVCQPNEVE